MRIDSHQHFWQYDPIRDQWISEEMEVIRRDFFPADLTPFLKTHNFEGCVAVQADQSEKETNFLLDQADQYPFIKGVVGWVDLQAKNVHERLEHFTKHPKFKGVRHILQAESDERFMLRPEFLRGISNLEKLGLTYDILILPEQLGVTIEFVQKFPKQKFVLDHLAKPQIRSGNMQPWKDKIAILAQSPNVYCKLSGMLTEADWKNWKEKDFLEYMDVIFEQFGTDRILFGSDWPVCLLAGSYSEALGVVQNYLSKFDLEQQANVMGKNAIKFYGLTL